MMQPPKGKTMTHNVGTTDQIFRIVLGVALVTASLLGYIGVWGWVGMVAIATGLFRFCPAYFPFGLSTCESRPGKLNP